MSSELTREKMAEMLRAALQQISEFSDNTNFYDDKRGKSYPIAETLASLDAEFPVFTKKEQAFIDIVGMATGLDGIEKYVIAMRDSDFDYCQLENGPTFADHDITFSKAYGLGLARALED